MRDQPATQPVEAGRDYVADYLLQGHQIVDEVPTYRGEGRCFL